VSRWRYVLVMFVLAAGVLSATPKSMSVTVRETQARATPSFLGPVLVILAYGDRVDVLEEQRDWIKVSLPGGKQGWVHRSALTEKRIALQAGSGPVEETASSSEVALAGKGFNKEVEAQYKAENDLDYTWVDRMEGFVVSPQQILTFVESGELRWTEGGTQ